MGDKRRNKARCRLTWTVKMWHVAKEKSETQYTRKLAPAT